MSLVAKAMGDKNLEPSKINSDEYANHKMEEHKMKPVSEMSFWEKLTMGLSMTMGMEHGGIAGRQMAKLMEEDIKFKFFFSLILTIPIVAYSPLGERIFGLKLPTPIPAPWIMFILTTPLYFYSGWIFLYSSYIALKNKTLNMAVLIAVGITAAYVFSVVLTLLGSQESFYEAAAMLTTFVLFGHWMEMKSRRGTTDALQALFNLVPPKARRIKNGIEELIPTSQVRIGDIIILKPGDRVPVDGEIIEGETAIDESLVTGESMPVAKGKGDPVIGGSINTSGSVKFKATKVGEDTALAQIVKLVEIAQNSKAPGQKIADRFAQYLVIVAVGGGLITFGVWFLFLGQPLLFALTFAISTVVIACPDALGLATPTAVAVGTGLGAKHNILIKDATTLEQVSKIQAVVLDKTGTITEGKPKITDVVAVGGFTEDELLRLDAAAETKSNHPLSQAVIEEAKKRRLKIPTDISKFKNIEGHGVEANVDGRQVLVGTIKLMKDRNIDIKPLQKEIERLLFQGKTIMVLAINGKVAGVAAAADQVKKNAKLAVEKMQESGLEIAMITGDNQKTAEAIGKQLGIKRIFAEVLPEDKAKYVKKLQEEGKFTAMVGDGVNDAPALAQADIGIAIGAGTDVAIETAKVVLMKSDPADVLRAIRLSKATVTKMKQNLFWASIYNLLAIPIAAGVLYPKFGISLRPEVSALLMSISSIIVATNAVLLNRAEKSLVKI
jgi:Cu2+-exporting ATPase